MSAVRSLFLAITLFASPTAVSAQQLHPLPVIPDPLAHSERIAAFIDRNDFSGAANDVFNALRSTSDRNVFAAQLAAVGDSGPVRHKAVASDRTVAGVARTICLYRARESAQAIGFYFFISVYRMSEAGWRMSNFKFNTVGDTHLPPDC